MRFLKNKTIKQRLTLIIMAISATSVLITTLSISGIGIVSLREKLIYDTGSFATLVGDRNAASVAFDAYDQARENLNNVLAVQPEVVKACLYRIEPLDDTIRVIATYINEGKIKEAKCPEDNTIRGFIRDGHLEVMRKIEKADASGHVSILGFIYLETTLKRIDEYIEEQLRITIVVVGFSLIISYFLAIWLQKTISSPILGLAATARKVSQSKDYTIRAKLINISATESQNELVILTDSFNEMLSEIDARTVQLRKQYAELEKARDAAESANRAKSNFLANISHELRTPLNAIIGFSSILMNQLFGPLGDEKYLEYARDINESGSHLLEIINDILDLSKAEAGKLLLNYEEVHIGKAINKCLTIVADRASKGRVALTADVPKMLPALLVDRLRLIQILLNVISNAVKFTPEGGSVNISVSTSEAGGEVSEFIIAVRDTGIGMSKEDIDSAFQRFGQVDSGLNRKYEGTGLGLPLTQKLMELHHGQIEIESEVGKGTLVLLKFPTQPTIDTSEEK